MLRILTIFLLLSTASILAQQAKKPKAQIDVDAPPEQKISHYLQRSTYYNTSQLDSSLYFVNKAGDIAMELENDSVDAKIRAHKGGILILAKRFEEGEALLIQNVETPNIDAFTLGMTHNNLGSSHNLKEEFGKATVNYLKATEIFEPLKDTVMLGKTYGNLGIIHARLKDIEKAIIYLNRALQFAGDNESLKMALTLNLSAVYYEGKQIDKAIATSIEAEKLAKKNNANSVLAILYSNLCNLYLEKDEYDTSIAYGLDALDLKRSMNQNSAIVLNNLGHAYLQKGDNIKALSNLNEALPSATGEARSLIFNNLSQTQRNMGNYQKALEYANLHIDIKDSLDLLAQQKNVNELTEKYESQKKQQELDLLNAKNDLSQNQIANQRNYIWALALFSLLAILVGFLLYRNQKTIQSLKTAKIQHRLLQAQLNPHFIFNALNSIQAFGYANNNEKLSDYVDSFSKLMRSILESSDQDFIAIEADSQTLKEYLYLQKLSTENSFETQIIIDNDVDPQIVIPPMFTQPFVENSVLHGVKNRKDGHIEVRYAEKNNMLEVTIEDNGEGLSNADKRNNKLHRSMSMDIIKDRVANLQKTNKYKCSFEVDSGKTGTIVHLTFPIRHKKLI